MQAARPVENPSDLMLPWEPQQRDFIAACHDRKKQFICAFCGLQAGKTIAGARACFELLFSKECLVLPKHLLGKRHAEFWILSKSYALVDVAIATFRSIVPPELFLGKGEMTEWGLLRQDSRTWWLRATPERVAKGDTLPVCLRGRTTHDPDAMRASPNLILVLGDECAHWPELGWKNLQGRAIVTKAKFIITTTPHGKNWCYRDLYVPGTNGSDKAVSIHQWRSEDNPYADKEYLKRLRLKFGPDYAGQELDGMFTTSIGYVYDFDRVLHMARPLPSRYPRDYPVRVVGVDPGYGDPYAAVLCLRDKEKHWWIADEMYLPSKATFQDAFPKLSAWNVYWKPSKFYVDKRRPTDWTMLKSLGLPAVPNLDIFGEDERRTIMPMVRIIQRLIREGRFHVAPHCEWTAEEAENYAFPDKEARNRGENPVGWRDHTLDSLRYCICAVEALPEDRRPRYREGLSGLPRSRSEGLRRPMKSPEFASVLQVKEQEFLKGLSKPKNRRERWIRTGSRGSNR